jgi:hypothetical protein
MTIRLRRLCFSAVFKDPDKKCWKCISLASFFAKNRNFRRKNSTTCKYHKMSHKKSSGRCFFQQKCFASLHLSRTDDLHFPNTHIREMSFAINQGCQIFLDTKTGKMYQMIILYVHQYIWQSLRAKTFRHS